MLALGRKVGDKIRIGDDIVVQIVKVKGDVVTVGIDAPRETPVHREEVYERIHQERDAA
jgi:carbon storage regulator